MPSAPESSRPTSTFTKFFRLPGFITWRPQPSSRIRSAAFSSKKNIHFIFYSPTAAAAASNTADIAIFSVLCRRLSLSLENSSIQHKNTALIRRKERVPWDRFFGALSSGVHKCAARILRYVAIPLTLTLPLPPAPQPQPLCHSDGTHQAGSSFPAIFYSPKQEEKITIFGYMCICISLVALCELCTILGLADVTQLCR